MLSQTARNAEYQLVKSRGKVKQEERRRTAYLSYIM